MVSARRGISSRRESRAGARQTRDTDAIQKVPAETSGQDVRGEIPVRGDEQANIDASRARLAQAPDLQSGHAVDRVAQRSHDRGLAEQGRREWAARIPCEGPSPTIGVIGHVNCRTLRQLGAAFTSMLKRAERRASGA